MAAEIKFYAGQGSNTWVDMVASGMGFYGAAFGNSVQVGQYQDSSFIITSADTPGEGPEATNCKFEDPSGIIVNGDVSIQPSAIVVSSGTMNIRFTYDVAPSSVKTQNCELRIFDRDDATNGATGVLTQVLQIVNGGSGVSSSGTAEVPASHSGWITPSGDSIVVPLLSSPGISGLSPSGVDTQDERHDWYICISATPISIGAKSAFGLYTQLEYL